MNKQKIVVKHGLAVIIAIGLLSACSSPEVVLTDTSTGSVTVITQEPTSISLPTLPPQSIPTEVPSEVSAQGFPIIEGPQLINFDMMDSKNGWGISETKLVRTMDSGLTWYDITPPGFDKTGFFPSVFFLDPLTGWVVTRGDNPLEGSLAITSDGGANWEIVPVPFDGGDLEFIDEKTGFIMVGRGVAAGSSAVDVYATSDGGHTWASVYVMQPGAVGNVNSLPFSGQKSGLGVSDAANLWIGGNIPMEGAVYLYKSEDGGKEWVQQDLNLPEGYQNSMTEIMPPVFFNSLTGILPVRMYGTNTVYVFFQTEDGGNTWRMTNPIAGNGSYSILSLNEIIVWDGGPDLHLTLDGGSNWSVVTTNIDLRDSFMKVDFTDVTTGWILTSDANSQNKLYRSTDGGATWNILIP